MQVVGGDKFGFDSRSVNNWKQSPKYRVIFFQETQDKLRKHRQQLHLWLKINFLYNINFFISSFSLTVSKGFPNTT